MPKTKPLRVCYFGTYRAKYNRNRILIQGLRSQGVEVIECHEPLWSGIDDRVEAVSGGWKRLRFWWRVLRTYACLLRRYRQVGDYDVMMVGYPGQLDVFLARLLSWWGRRPLAWDVFMSIYLIAWERGLEGASRLGVRLLRLVEWMALRLPDQLILDTEEYARWFQDTYGIPAARFALIPTGADDTVFRPDPDASEPPAPPLRVLYYGTFIPNHGVLTMVEAARRLAYRHDICFEFVGDGPQRAVAEARVREAGLTNVRFVGWLPPEALREQIQQAHVCLGVFGATPQSLMTVQNKIYECLAMARSVITGDGPAVRQAFRHGEHLWLVPREDPKSLVDAIEHLLSRPDLRAHIAAFGYSCFQDSFTVQCNGQRLITILQTLVRGKL